MSPRVFEFLDHCGVPPRKLDGCSSDTRMFHDLGIYGDIATSCMDALVQEYEVDLDGFQFDDYFPPEYPGSNWLSRILLWLVPGAAVMAHRRESYKPFRLENLDCILQTKRWKDCVDLEAR